MRTGAREQGPPVPMQQEAAPAAARASQKTTTKSGEGIEILAQLIDDLVRPRKGVLPAGEPIGHSRSRPMPTICSAEKTRASTATATPAASRRSAPRNNSAPARASGNSARITRMLVASHSAGSQRLCGAPSRQAMSRALENVPTQPARHNQSGEERINRARRVSPNFAPLVHFPAASAVRGTDSSRRTAPSVPARLDGEGRAAQLDEGLIIGSA